MGFLIRASKQPWKPPACSNCGGTLTQSSPGMLCRACLDGRRTHCKSCGNDISILWERCADCQRRTVFDQMRDKLIAERKRGAIPNMLREEAAKCERLAEQVSGTEGEVLRLDAKWLRERADQFAVEDVEDDAPPLPGTIAA